MASITPAGIIMRQLILTHAATPHGYRSVLSRGLPNHKHAGIVCARLMLTGQLFRAKIYGAELRYFTTAEAAEHYIATARPEPKVTAKPPSRAPAAIVYPPSYKFTCRPLAPPRNQVVRLPGVHGGMGQM